VREKLKVSVGSRKPPGSAQGRCDYRRSCYPQPKTSAPPPEVLSLIDASQARIEIDDDDWSELNVPGDDLNQAIVEFHAERQSLHRLRRSARSGCVNRREQQRLPEKTISDWRLIPLALSPAGQATQNELG
jgi:hypothetical protein